MGIAITLAQKALNKNHPHQLAKKQTSQQQGTYPALLEDSSLIDSRKS